MRAINKHINKSNIKVPQNILKKLTKYSPDDYDLSDENIGKCYTLRSDDSDIYSNEKIRNYCLLNKHNIFVKEVWENFLVLANSMPWHRTTANSMGENIYKITGNGLNPM